MRLVHVLAGVFEDVVRHRSSPLTIVPTGSPVSARSMLPSTSMLKTRIGSSLSMHSEIAVLSMTCRPRLQHVDVGEFVELDGIRVRLGVGVVDAVDLGRLHDALGVDLERAQRGGRVGGEVRVARAGGEDDDAALLHVADRAPPDVGLGDCLHLDGAHDAREDAVALERVLQRERVHDGGEHAHVVGLGAVHALGRGGRGRGRCCRRPRRWRSRCRRARPS